MRLRCRPTRGVFISFTPLIVIISEKKLYNYYGRLFFCTSMNLFLTLINNTMNLSQNKNNYRLQKDYSNRHEAVYCSLALAALYAAVGASRKCIVYYTYRSKAPYRQTESVEERGNMLQVCMHSKIPSVLSTTYLDCYLFNIFIYL